MNPRLTFSFVSATFLAIAATGLVINTDPAVAQPAGDVVEEVLVEAPIAVHQGKRGGAAGARIEIIELKRRVSYSDLDLSKYADVIELEARVEFISKESCEKLSNMFPHDSATEKFRCIKEAINSANGQVQAAIAAAS